MKLLLSLALFFAFLLCPAACADGVRNGLSLAARQALPALFPFFVASSLLVRSGLSDRLARLAARPLTFLYGLPPAAAPAVILGLTGGYPVGAATTAELLNHHKLSPADASRVNLFCNCASPGFCIGLAGLGIFGSARTGVILYIIHAGAALLAGLLIARDKTGTSSALPLPVQETQKEQKTGFSEIFCQSVQQAAATALTVTAFLTVFSVLLALLAPVFGFLPGGMALSGLLELTNGLNTLPALPLPIGAQLTLASFLLGFGGLAVQFQVCAIAAPCGLSVDGFTLAKLLHGTLAAATTALLFRLSPEALTVFAPAAPAVSVDWSAALLILLPIFSICSGNRTGNAV